MTPTDARRSRISGDFSAFAISALILSMIGLGVPAGA